MLLKRYDRAIEKLAGCLRHIMLVVVFLKRITIQ
jgi:hypothetical protein